MRGFASGRAGSRFVPFVTALAIVASGMLLPAVSRGSGPVVRATPEQGDRPQRQATTEEPAEDDEHDDERGPLTALPGGTAAFLPFVARNFAVAESRQRRRLAALHVPAPIRGPPATTAIR